MKKKVKLFKLNDVPVYKHLEHNVRNTTYAHRLQWLQQANDWVRLLRKKESYPASCCLLEKIMTQ